MTKQKTFAPPFRLGRKQKRAVLDSLGREVVIFPVGMEDYAAEYAEFLNSKQIKEVPCTSSYFMDKPESEVFIKHEVDISTSIPSGAVMFQFDDEAPIHLFDSYDKAKLTLEINHPEVGEENSIFFASETGKTFSLFIRRFNNDSDNTIGNTIKL